MNFKCKTCGGIDDGGYCDPCDALTHPIVQESIVVPFREVRNEDAVCGNCPLGVLSGIDETVKCHESPVVVDKQANEWCSRHPNLYSLEEIE